DPRAVPLRPHLGRSPRRARRLGDFGRSDQVVPAPGTTRHPPPDPPPERSPSMSTLVLKMSMSLDGYVARTDGSNDWIFPSYSDDATAWTVDTLRHASAHLMGSTTYRGMAAHWPNDDSPFAAPMNSIPKIVFSATMRNSIWDETTFIDGDLATAIAELKQQQADGYLLAHGGARFVR